MAKQSGSAFDALLQTFGDDGDRTTFTALADKNPALREFGLRQDDYSRKLDEHRAELQELQGWREWKQKNWESDPTDSTHGWTKAEKQKMERLEALESEKAALEGKLAEVEFGGSDMTFEQIEQIATETMKKHGIDPDKFVPKDTLVQKEKEVGDMVRQMNGITLQAAIDTPYLNQLHAKEFGEYFDPHAFLKAANDAGAVDLRKFYETSFVNEARTNKIKADAEARVKAAQEDKYKAVAEANKRVEEISARAQSMAPLPQATAPPPIAMPPLSATGAPPSATP